MNLRTFRYITLLIICYFGSSLAMAQDESLLEIPEPMPMVETGEYDILNVVLIGTAAESIGSPGLTDSLMILSINRTLETVSIVSVPRDYYAYIPDIGMRKINQAMFYGDMGDENRTGIELLKETIAYNLGVSIDYYARINFTQFLQLIDAFGGIDITVDCALQDWKIIDPEQDKNDPNNWEMFTLWQGYHHMDAQTALWYARSRRTSLETDRGRRQQDILRALWHKIQAQGLLENLPTLWNTMSQIVETDLSLTDLLGLLPMVSKMQTSDVNYYHFRQPDEMTQGYTPDEGRFIWIPNREAVHELMQEIIIPMTIRRVEQWQPHIAIVNVTGVRGMGYVAADRLELEGFRTTVLEEQAAPRQYNLIYDFTGLQKNNPLERLQKTLRTTDEGVIVEPDPNRDFDYKVYLGETYPIYACTRSIIPPDDDPPTDETNPE